MSIQAYRETFGPGSESSKPLGGFENKRVALKKIKKEYGKLVEVLGYYYVKNSDSVIRFYFKEENMKFVRCSSCGKQVSNEVCEDLTVRAYVECPECIQKNLGTRENELRILNNFIRMMPKLYRNHPNWVIVQDILLASTSTSGRTSCMKKCVELGIDPDGYTVS